MIARIVFCLRWLLVLPGAFAGSYLAYFLMGVVAKIGFDGDTSSLLARANYEAVTGVALGGGFVFAGAMIAPAYSKQTAFVLTVIGLLIALALIIFDVTKQSYWSVWNGVFVAIGIGAVMYGISENGVLHLWQKMTRGLK